MNKSLTIFDHPELGSVRTTIDETTGDPLFVAADVARVLGYVDPQKAVRTHCPGRAKRPTTDALGRTQQITILPERDVYRLIMRSKLPAAIEFEEWVVGTVLPSIRKNGGYISGQEDTTDRTEILANAMKVADAVLAEKDERIAQQQLRLLETEPKAQLVDDTFVDDEDALPLKDFGRTLSRLNQMQFKADLYRSTCG